MINEELKQFIKDSLVKGVSPATIKMQLLSTGWSEADIAEGLASVTPPTSAPIAPTSTPAPIGKSPSSFATATPIIGTGQASSQASFVAQIPAQQDSAATLFGIGIISILVAGAVTFLFKIPFINPLYFVGASLVLSLIQVVILHMWTKIFKVPTASWGRAFLVVGVPGLLVVFISLLTMIQVPSVVSLVLGLGVLVGWFILFIKVYKTGFGQAFGVGFLTMLITGIIAVIAFFVLGLGALFSFGKSISAGESVSTPLILDENGGMMEFEQFSQDDTDAPLAEDLEPGNSSSTQPTSNANSVAVTNPSCVGTNPSVILISPQAGIYRFGQALDIRWKTCNRRADTTSSGVTVILEDSDGTLINLYQGYAGVPGFDETKDTGSFSFPIQDFEIEAGVYRLWVSWANYNEATDVQSDYQTSKVSITIAP